MVAGNGKAGLIAYPELRDMPIQGPCDVLAGSSDPQQIVPMPDQPWHKLAMDVVGPIQSLPQSARYAITLVYDHSKWAEVQ